MTDFDKTEILRQLDAISVAISMLGTISIYNVCPETGDHLGKHQELPCTDSEADTLIAVNEAKARINADKFAVGIPQIDLIEINTYGAGRVTYTHRNTKTGGIIEINALIDGINARLNQYNQVYNLVPEETGVVKALNSSFVPTTGPEANAAVIMAMLRPLMP